MAKNTTQHQPVITTTASDMLARYSGKKVGTKYEMTISLEDAAAHGITPSWMDKENVWMANVYTDGNGWQIEYRRTRSNTGVAKGDWASSLEVAKKLSVILVQQKLAAWAKAAEKKQTEVLTVVRMEIVGKVDIGGSSFEYEVATSQATYDVKPKRYEGRGKVTGKALWSNGDWQPIVNGFHPMESYLDKDNVWTMAQVESGYIYDPASAFNFSNSHYDGLSYRAKIVLAGATEDDVNRVVLLMYNELNEYREKHVQQMKALNAASTNLGKALSYMVNTKRAAK